MSLRLLLAVALGGFLGGLLVQRSCGQASVPTKPTTDPVTLASGIVRSGEQQAAPGGAASAAAAAGVPVEVIVRDARSQGASVTGANVVVVHSGGKTQTGLASTSSSPATPPPASPPAAPLQPSAPCSAPLCPFAGKVERLKLTEDFGELRVPWGEVAFASDEARPWSVTTLPRTLRLATVMATREDGTHSVYSQVAIDVDGTKYVLPVADARWTEQRPEPRWRWSARAYLGVGGGWSLGDSSAGLWAPLGQLSVASYGSTTATPSWAVGLVGVGITSQRRPALAITPAAWNAGDALPVVDALFLGPTLLLDSQGQPALFASVFAKL